MIWLDIIGISEAGLDGLNAEQITRIKNAKHVMTAQRWLPVLQKLGVAAEAWPSPFADVYARLEAWRGEASVILATGDPLWYGAGSALVKKFPIDEIRIDPAPSGFQLAASRMGWIMDGVTTMTLHGRDIALIRREVMPSARILILADDATTPQKIAAELVALGAGEAVLCALQHIGGADEARAEGTAQIWAEKPPKIADFHVLAVACPEVIDGFLGRGAGLPDSAYSHDGQLTKAEVRAMTLARLQPVAGQLLWDLGCGSGAVGIEWMRGAHQARAIGVDCRPDRIKIATANARQLGVPDWQGIAGDNRAVLGALPPPDAVFIGGGLSHELVEDVLVRLKQGARLVANAVTLESEGVLIALHQQHGGRLVRIAISHAEPIGAYHGWRSAMPVTQWQWVGQWMKTDD